jgi:threonine/homoserine/homoserine lactone efflux protein
VLSTSHILLMMLGGVIVLAMPGPTNTLLATAGHRWGIRRAVYLTAGEFAGYLVSISAWGYFLSHVATVLTWLPTLLRIASSLYLAYLSVGMWHTANLPPSSAQRTINLRVLFTATLLNPKAILFAGTIFPAAAFQDLATYLEAMTVFTILQVPIGLMWIVFGAELGSGRRIRVSQMHMQRCASIVLAAFSLSLAWAVLH